MRDDVPVEELLARLSRVGDALTQLAGRPDLVEELTAALNDWDGDRWQGVLQEIELPQPREPGDCITIVTTFATARAPLTWVEVCDWTSQAVLTDEWRQRLISTLQTARLSVELVSELKRLGLVRCQRVQGTVGSLTYEISRPFCPGLPPTPGPDSAPSTV
jgi:hypothetical protein